MSWRNVRSGWPGTIEGRTLISSCGGSRGSTGWSERRRLVGDIGRQGPHGRYWSRLSGDSRLLCSGSNCGWGGWRGAGRCCGGVLRLSGRRWRGADRRRMSVSRMWSWSVALSLVGIQVENAALEIGGEERFSRCRGRFRTCRFVYMNFYFARWGNVLVVDWPWCRNDWRLAGQVGRTRCNGLPEHSGRGRRRRGWRGEAFFQRTFDNVDLILVNTAQLASNLVEACIRADFQQDIGINIQVFCQLIDAYLGFLRRRQASPL